MDFMVCAYGEPAEMPFMLAVGEYVAGVELQSCDRTGILSEAHWDEMLVRHRSLLPRLSGRLAVHGPFSGIYWGYKDHLLNEAVRRRMDKTFEMVCALGPDTLVLHTGCPETMVRFSMADMWLEAAEEFWREEIQRYAERGVRVVLENVVEQTPDLMIALAERVNSGFLGLCLDVGHVNLCSQLAPAQWIEQMGQRLKHVHLHDNDGRRDDHLPVGRGTIDFDSLFEALYRHAPNVTASLEILAEPQVVVETVRQVVGRYGKKT